MPTINTVTRKKDPHKDQPKGSDVSLKQDLFVVVMGLLLTLLVFALFALVSGRGFDIIFPRSRRTLIGDDGAALDLESTKFIPGVAHEYIQIGIVLSSIALVVFIGAFIILRWAKKDEPFLTDQPDAPSRDPSQR